MRKSLKALITALYYYHDKSPKWTDLTYIELMWEVFLKHKDLAPEPALVIISCYFLPEVESNWKKRLQDFKISDQVIDIIEISSQQIAFKSTYDLSNAKERLKLIKILTDPIAVTIKIDYLKLFLDIKTNKLTAEGKAYQEDQAQLLVFLLTQMAVFMSLLTFEIEEIPFLKPEVVVATMLKNGFKKETEALQDFEGLTWSSMLAIGKIFVINYKALTGKD